MNNERLDYLLAYMNGLTKLANSEVSYRCNTEIGECVGWIREEMTAINTLDKYRTEANKILKIQGDEGNWNYDRYMHGMYNGMELLVATLENRETEYREAPESFIADYESEVVPRD